MWWKHKYNTAKKVSGLLVGVFCGKSAKGLVRSVSHYLIRVNQKVVWINESHSCPVPAGNI